MAIKEFDFKNPNNRNRWLKFKITRDDTKLEYRNVEIPFTNDYGHGTYEDQYFINGWGTPSDTTLTLGPTTATHYDDTFRNLNIQWDVSGRLASATPTDLFSGPVMKPIKGTNQMIQSVRLPNDKYQIYRLNDDKTRTTLFRNEDLSGGVQGMDYDDWGNLIMYSNRGGGTILVGAGTRFKQTGEMPILPTDSIHRLEDVDLTDITMGQFLAWNGSRLVASDGPYGGRGSVPGLIFRGKNVLDSSSNLYYYDSKYYILDRLTTIDKVRITNKNNHSGSIAYNIYVNQYEKVGNDLSKVSTIDISATVAPNNSGELEGSSLVTLPYSVNFSNNHYLEVLIERQLRYSEISKTVAHYKFNQKSLGIISNTTIDDDLSNNTLYVNSHNEIVDGYFKSGLSIGDSSHNFMRLPMVDGSNVVIRSMTFWIKDWRGGFILDGTNVLTNSGLTKDYYVSLSNTGIVKFQNQDGKMYTTSGLDSDSSNNRISLLQRDDWNFVYVEFSATTTFTSATPLLFGASASGGKGGYVIEDLRLHNDALTESEITNIHRTYDTNDVTVEFVSIPVERHMTDLSDVSSVYNIRSNT